MHAQWLDELSHQSRARRSRVNPYPWYMDTYGVIDETWQHIVEGEEGEITVYFNGRVTAKNRRSALLRAFRIG